MNDQCNKALFLDLDHTLIHPRSGNTFPTDIDDWELAYGDVVGRLHQYKAKGYKLVIVTNQGGVDANFITEHEVQQKLKNVVKALQRPDADEDYIYWYYCPDMKSYFRKPNPGMAYRAALDLRLDLSESIMVGDLGTDHQFAKRAGIGSFKYANEFFSNPTRRE